MTGRPGPRIGPCQRSLFVARAVRFSRCSAALAVHAPAAARRAVAFHGAVADPALMARVLAASRVDARGSSPDASYWRDFLAWLASLTGIVGRQQPPRGWFLWTVAALLGAGVAALLVRRWRAARRSRADAKPASVVAMAAGGGARAAAGVESAGWDAAAWRLELDRLLTEERLAEALGAFWWWLARSLAGARAEATWTGGDLLGWSRRDDLRALVRQLDVLRYGRRPSSSAEIRRLVARLEADLA
jgi:hypothetical protein